MWICRANSTNSPGWTHFCAYTYKIAFIHMKCLSLGHMMVSPKKWIGCSLHAQKTYGTGWKSELHSSCRKIGGSVWDCTKLQLYFRYAGPAHILIGCWVLKQLHEYWYTQNLGQTLNRPEFNALRGILHYKCFQCLISRLGVSPWKNFYCLTTLEVRDRAMLFSISARIFRNG